ncbi:MULTISPECIES: ribokinase [Cryobacterium]|uniref:Ribokinase n=1 Tax=Cryobacterium breve TaxID=1259258 RepID=A0ABY2IWT0_9MICO|nr:MULTISPECIES: ribokinase [Cryobacterium]TFC90638.1 ribokinase [Cryobacterium sp. TmT3-12]TFC96455.1 ribokinase [Cryobacterium breve]
MNRIAVLGSANMDLVVRQPRVPRPGETIFGSGFTIGPGGTGLNQAVAAARLGAAVDFLGMVGADQHGEQLRGVLATEGIRDAGLEWSMTPTGTAHISVVDSGENSIVVVPGANADLAELTEVQRSAITAAAFLVLQCEMPVSVLTEGLVAARAAGVFTVLTPAPAMALPDGLLDLVDLIVPNRLEAAELSGETDPVRAAEVLSRGGRWAIVTLGAEGAVVAFDGAALGLAPARPVRAVDTTAAGDTFVGALVARLVCGARNERAAAGAGAGAAEAAGAFAGAEAAGASAGASAGGGTSETGGGTSETGGESAGAAPLRAVGVTETEMIDAVRWATVAASVSVTRQGATTSMPTRAEVTAILT